MYGHRLLLVNSDAFYQSMPHTLDLSDDCGLVKDHTQRLFIFFGLYTIFNNTSGEACV